MNPTALLFVATAAFVGTHFVTSTPLRKAIVGTVGERAYLALYSLVAFATLGWMIYAYSRAPVDSLWPGLRSLPLAVMPFAFIFIAAGMLSKNPTAMGQSKLLAEEDIARGILRVTRHPVQWAFLLWSLAHILARGNLKSIIFFGGMAVVSTLGMVLIDSRKAREYPGDWPRFAARTSNIPFLAIAQGRNRLDLGEIGAVKIVVGILLYAVVLGTHSRLFGAIPW